MSDQDKLPVCALCGEAPYVSHLWKTLRCESDGCEMKSVEMSEADWRRLMDRTRLAPERVEALKNLAWLVEESEGVFGFHLNGNVSPWGEFAEDFPAAIRAALAALGEPAP